MPSTRFSLIKKNISYTPLIPRIYTQFYDVLPVYLINYGITRGIRYSGEKKPLPSSDVLRIDFLRTKRNESVRIYEEAVGTLITFGMLESIEIPPEPLLLLWNFFMHLSKPYILLEKQFSAIIPSPLSIISASHKKYGIMPFSIFSSIALLDFTKPRKVKRWIIGSLAPVNCVELRVQLMVFLPYFEHWFTLTPPFKVVIPEKSEYLCIEEDLLRENAEIYIEKKQKIISDIILICPFNRDYLFNPNINIGNCLGEPLMIVCEIPLIVYPMASTLMGKLSGEFILREPNMLKIKIGPLATTLMKSWLSTFESKLTNSIYHFSRHYAAHISEILYSEVARQIVSSLIDYLIPIGQTNEHLYIPSPPLLGCFIRLLGKPEFSEIREHLKNLLQIPSEELTSINLLEKLRVEQFVDLESILKPIKNSQLFFSVWKNTFIKYRKLLEKYQLCSPI